MTKNNKIYFPKDESNELFCIAQSKDGLVISLSDFGYSGLHITFFVKQMPEDKIKINLHITREGKSNCSIFKYERELTTKYIEEYFSKKIESIINELANIVRSLLSKTVSLPPTSACMECFNLENFDFSNKISNRKSAEELFIYLRKIRNEDLAMMKLVHSCNKDKHNIYFDYISGHMYVKMPFGFLTWDDWDLSMKEFIKIIDSAFKEEFKSVEKVIDKIKIKLKEVKYETTNTN